MTAVIMSGLILHKTSSVSVSFAVLCVILICTDSQHIESNKIVFLSVKFYQILLEIY